MFDLSWGELVVIGIVALIAIGPKELPTVLRTLAQYMGKIRRMASEFQGQFQEALREAEVSDLKKQAEEMTSSVTDFSNFDPMANAQKEIETAFNPEQDKAADAPAEAAAEAPTQAAPATPLPEVTALPEIDVPLPEPPAPVTDADFTPAEPPAAKEPAKEPAKQAGGGA